jgi:hypothetical protein
MAAKKSKVSQIQKDIDKFLVDAEKSMEKHARDTLKRVPTRNVIRL